MAKKDEPLSPGEVAAAKARVEGTPLDGANGAHVLGISGQEKAGEQLAKASRDNAEKAAAAEADGEKADAKASHATQVKAQADAQKGIGSALAGASGPGTTTPSGQKVEAPDNIAANGPAKSTESKDASGK